MLDTGLWVHTIPTAKPDTNKKTQARLDEHLPKEALLDSVLRCKESLLEHGRKKQTFLTCCQKCNSDTRSASARHPWAQSYFITQMSTRRDRWNNPTKPDCASTESKEDVRELEYSVPTSGAFHWSVSHVGKKKVQKTKLDLSAWAQVLFLVGRLHQTYRLQ